MIRSGYVLVLGSIVTTGDGTEHHTDTIAIVDISRDGAAAYSSIHFIPLYVHSVVWVMVLWYLSINPVMLSK